MNAKASRPWVIFDFDGTLCDNFHISIGILNELSEKHAFKKVSEEALPGLRGKTAREVIAELGIPLHKLPVISAQARRRMHCLLPELRPVLGMEGVLAQIAESQGRLAILTSNSLTNVRAFLSRHPFPKFEWIESGMHLFGKGRALKKLLRQLEVPAQDVWYVGDEGRDIEAAREAKTKVAAVSWGFQSPECLSRLAPDRMIQQPSDLLHLLD